MKLLALLLYLSLAVCAAPVKHSTEKALDDMLHAKRELLASSETNFFEDGGNAGPIHQRSHH